MEELKLVGVLIVSLMLQIVLVIPRILSWFLGTIESFFRILKNTVNSLIDSLKKEVLKK